MNTSKNTTFSRFIILTILSLVLMSFDLFHLLSFPKKYALSVLTPFEYGFYTIFENTKSNFSFLGFWKSGYSEIIYLKQRNLELTVTAVKAKKLQEENEIFKTQFATRSFDPQNFLPAEVTGFSRYLFINKGIKDGIKVGQVVILNTVLVGRIKDVEENFAKIVLLTDPDEKIAGITTTNRTKGIIYGVFSTELLFDEVLQADKLGAEETIETYGQENIPSGLLVGKITKIERSESAIFQSARAKPLLDYNKLRMVFVKIK